MAIAALSAAVAVLWGSARVAAAAATTVAAAETAGPEESMQAPALALPSEDWLWEGLDESVPCRCPFDCIMHFTGELLDTEFSDADDQCLKLVDVVSPGSLKVKGGSGLSLIIDGVDTVIPGGITLEKGSGNLCILNGPLITGMILVEGSGNVTVCGKRDGPVRPGEAPFLKIVDSGSVNLGAEEGTISELIVDGGNGRIDCVDTLVNGAKVKVAERQAGALSIRGGGKKLRLGEIALEKVRDASVTLENLQLEGPTTISDIEGGNVSIAGFVTRFGAKLERVGGAALRQVDATLGRFEILGCAFASIFDSNFSDLTLRGCGGKAAVSHSDVRLLYIQGISGGAALEANSGQELDVSQAGGPILVDGNVFEAFIRLREFDARVDAHGNTGGELQVIDGRGNVTVVNNTMTSLLIEKNLRVSLLNNSGLVLICTENAFICGSSDTFEAAMSQCSSLEPCAA